MTVDDVFHIRNRGTVTTGMVELGTLRVGDTVAINDGELARVDGIEAYKKILDEANAGDSIGVLFRELDHSRVKRGDVLTAG
jgi:elongation factor Tu